MKYTPAIEPIEISPTLRLVDHDENQYAIELKTIVQVGKHAGDVRWTVIAYCGSVKSLPAVVLRHLMEDAVSVARKAAEAEFGVSGLPEKLAALPPKTGKKGQNDE